MITAIYLKDTIFKSYSSSNDPDFIRNLSKINIFIGANNSGKSRFERILFINDKYSTLRDEFDHEGINDIIDDFRNEFIKYIDNNTSQSFKTDHRYKEIISSLDNLKKIEYLNDDLKIYDLLTNPILFSINLAYQKTQMHELKKRIEKNYIELINEFFENNKPNYGIGKIYIPTLRGLRKIGYDQHGGTTERADRYFYSTVNDYFNQNGTGDNRKLLINKIYTGLNLYEDIHDLLLGSKHERDIVRNFENFIKENFFPNQDFSIIPRIKDDVVHVRIGNHEHPIYELGDGIQSLIILTYPLFINKDKTLQVFIEEPEQHLHPGLQRIFLETLMKKEFKNFQYFITTHSNHFLDMTLDLGNISVYTFKKVDDVDNTPHFAIENVENEDSNILELIGARNSSVFLSNCTIWVEGISDRIYIRKYLEMYQKIIPTKDKHFREDTHFSFVEYGGNNITHWSFLEDADPAHKNIQVEKLCGKLFLITDKDGNGLTKDGNKTKKAKRQEDLKKVLNERYYCLDAREIENILSPQILIKVMESHKPKDTNLIYKVFVQEDYKDKKIGNFLDKQFTNKTKSFEDDSGTINYKLNFAKSAVSNINSFSDLSSEAQSLTKKLYEFIKANNP